MVASRTNLSLRCLMTLLSATAVVARPGSWTATTPPPPPPVSCPAPCHCSKTGTTVNCEGKRLTSIPDGIPPLVEVLYLDHNNFVTLRRGALFNLTHLQKVYLRNNQIQTFQPQAFHHLPLLSELYLTNNNIASLLPDTFEGVDSLTLLNVGANKLTAVPDLHSLPGLKKLYLEGNQIRDATIPAGLAHVKNLNAIVLSNNNISTLTDKTFAVLASSTLRRLDIARNGLRNISVGALRPLTSLQSLQIGVNPLDGGQLENVLHGLSSDLSLESLDIRNIQLGGSLPTLSFSILSNTSLKTLIFKNNRVVRIPERAFSHLPKLGQLELSGCHIQKVEDNAFVDLPELRMLFLNNNLDLTAVPKNLPASLYKLYLQFNRLARLQAGGMQNLGQLLELYLSNNNIHEVSEDSFMGLENLRILHLQNNRLNSIPKKLFAPLPNLRTLILKNNNIKSLKPNPGAMAPLASLTYLDMSDNQCSYIPFDFLADLTSLQTLNLDNNVLGGLLASDFKGHLLANTRKLQTLSLANNNIQYIHDAQFRNLFALQHLHLKDNRLSSWGPNLFYTAGRTLTTLDLSSNQIALMNMTSVRNLQHLRTLNLSFNPFACTCDLLWFRSWMDNTTIDLVNKTTYKCNSPPEWNAKPLSDFGPDKINCIDYTWYYVGGAIGLTLVIAFIICYIVYRQRWFIRLRLHRLGKAIGEGRCCNRRRRRAGYDVLAGQDVPDKRYDFYVIAAEEDTRWVCEKLLPKLDNGPTLEDQQQHYQGRFSLYFEYRDALTGENRISSFDKSMPASRGVLIVLTRHLDKDAWCRFLIEQAYSLKVEGSIENIQIIMIARVPPRHIPRLLHQQVEKGQYKEWPDNADQNFIDHLEDALHG